MKYFPLLYLLTLLILLAILPGDFFFYEVQPGDTLWAIATEFCGGGWHYPEIVAANSRQILDPNLIYPGQVFLIPQ